MSGLSKRELDGCRKMLSRLSDADLIALCDTVTNRMITVDNTREAMDAILTYSQSPEELLQRRKVYRDIIFKYLASEDIVMPPTAEKSQLVKKTLQLWGRDMKASEAVDANKDLPNARAEVAEPEYMMLGKQFSQWFYQLLNTQNPALGQKPLDWGPQHFWEDAQLTLSYSTDMQQTDMFEGAELVSHRFLALVRDERLYFCPNLEPHGLMCGASPHGLVAVAVAGTIHRERTCLGIFEQAFGLIRSPLDGHSWKIKFTRLKIRRQEGGEEMASPALTCDSKGLLALCEPGS
ncbi:hypothetical protein GJAV_G00209730 [Gymnothorax javanicus]|nr:hypothetical protein GJAV_G00209730 [Gymnothorax javanicus]